MNENLESVQRWTAKRLPSGSLNPCVSKRGWS